MLVDVFAQIGRQAHVYADHETLFRKLDGAVPELVVLDSTNDEQCRATCRRLFKHGDFNNVPLIMLVNDNERTALNDDFDAGATNVFVKPCTPEFLRERLSKFVSGQDAGKKNPGPPESNNFANDGLPDISFEIDSDGRVLRCLSGIDQESLLKPNEIGGQRLSECLTSDAALLLQAKMRGALKSRKDAEFALRVRGDNKSEQYDVRLIVRGRNRLLAIFRKLEPQSSRPVPQAHRLRDTLTRLTTRELFMAEVDENLAEAKLREEQLAVICVDLDRFTKINNTLGRSAGDIVLQESADRLRRCFERLELAATGSDLRADVPIARMAGDEFVCMLRKVESREAVVSVADSIRDVFNEPVDVSGVPLHITPSIGISIFPADGNDAEILCANARAALDEARFEGVDSRAFFTDTLKFRSLKRPDLIKELGWAIENDQLELHYLPRVDLQSGDVTGMEALLRWIHPLRGSVPLSDVIPLAEVSGLMRPLGEWILATACAEAATWAARCDSAPGVSVNLSADEFSRDDLSKLVAKALQDNDLCASRLQFEVTEALLVRYRHSQRQLQQLQALGTKVAIDDFGTGHSSLSLLSQMPIDAIKIDRSFVEGAHRSSDQAAVCTAIIAMAHALSIRVIAEGVETDQQLSFLLQQGCDAAQGFLYSRPLPAGDVTPFLEAYGAQIGKSTISNLEQARQQVG